MRKSFIFVIWGVLLGGCLYNFDRNSRIEENYVDVLSKDYY